MKKLICLLSLFLFTFSTFAQAPTSQKEPAQTITFDNFSLELSKIYRDSVVYEGTPEFPYQGISLEIMDTDETDWNLLFGSELEANDLTFISQEPGHQEAYLSKTYYLLDDKTKTGDALFTLARGKETPRGIRLYIFSLTTNFQRGDTSSANTRDDSNMTRYEAFQYQISTHFSQWLEALFKL